MVMSTVTWIKTVALEDYERPFIIAASESSWDYGRVFTTKRLENKTWQTFPYAGFQPPKVTGELEVVRYLDAEELRKAVFTAIKFSNGFTLSEELLEDNRNIPDLLQSFANDMGTGFSYVKEQFMTSILNNAFVVYDLNYTPNVGEAMVQLNHALTKAPGKTISNYGGISDITYGAVYDAIDYFRSGIFSEAGLPVNDMAVTLVCNPIHARLAEKVINNTTGYEPDNVDRNSNTLPNMGICYNRLLDTNKWFVIGKKMKPHMQFRVRRPPQTKWDDAFDNEGRKCKTSMRISAGCTDYRFIYGFQTT